MSRPKAVPWPGRPSFTKVSIELMTPQSYRTDSGFKDSRAEHVEEDSVRPM